MLCCVSESVEEELQSDHLFLGTAEAADCLLLGKTYTFVLGQCYYVETSSLAPDDSIENCHDKFGPTRSGRLYEPNNMVTCDVVVTAVAAINPGISMF